MNDWRGNRRDQKREGTREHAGNEYSFMFYISAYTDPDPGIAAFDMFPGMPLPCISKF
jgi:hypothetical protein